MSIEEKREDVVPEITAKNCGGVYPVDKILDRKKKGSVYKYLVTLKNFPGLTRWETAEELYSVIHMVHEFDKNYQPKKRGRKPKIENKENLENREEKNLKENLNEEDKMDDGENKNVETAPNSDNKHKTNDEDAEMGIENPPKENLIEKLKTPHEKRRKKTNLQLLIESVPNLKLRQCQVPIKDLFKDPTNELLYSDKKIKLNTQPADPSTSELGINEINPEDEEFESASEGNKRRKRSRRNLEDNDSESSEYVPHKESEDEYSEEVSLDQTLSEDDDKGFEISEDSFLSQYSKVKKSKEKEKKIKNKEEISEKISDQSKMVKCDISLVLPKDTVVPVTSNKNPGNINYDCPKRIVYAKNIIGKGIYCMVEWKKNKEGKTPDPSYYPSDIIKKKYPELLLEYYQKRIESNKPKEDPKKVYQECAEKFIKKRGRKPKMMMRTIE